MNTYRLFIAIQLSSDLLADLQRAQRRLQQQLAPYPLRWSRPEGLHLTLKFLGETEADRVPGIRQALLHVAQSRQAFALPVGGLGVFPNSRRPQVLWIGVHDQGHRLQHLAEAVDAAMHRLGWPREKRPFRGHLTLARVKKHASPRERRELGARVQALRGYEDLGMLPVQSLHLMRSQLHPDGAVYTELVEVRLAGGNQ